MGSLDFIFEVYQMREIKAVLLEFSRSGKNQFGIDSEDLKGSANWFKKGKKEGKSVKRKPVRNLISRRGRNR